MNCRITCLKKYTSEYYSGWERFVLSLLRLTRISEFIRDSYKVQNCTYTFKEEGGLIGETGTNDSQANKLIFSSAIIVYFQYNKFDKLSS